MNIKVTVGEKCDIDDGAFVPIPKCVLVEVPNGATWFGTAADIDEAIAALQNARAEAFPDA